MAYPNIAYRIIPNHAIAYHSAMRARGDSTDEAMTSWNPRSLIEVRDDQTSSDPIPTIPTKLMANTHNKIG